MSEYKRDIPKMYISEWAFLRHHLESTDNVLEYGSGASTNIIAGLVGHLTSIEFDQTWYDEVKSRVSQLPNVDLRFIPPANTNEPLKPARKENWQDYINFPKTTDMIWDKVLIDGRARQFCAVSILENITEDSLVFVDDFAKNGSIDPPNRERYLSILEHYDVVEIVRGMVMLKKKSARSSVG
jgi:predicted O-methyltransferase YrrM